MIYIDEYKEEYAKGISDIVLTNMYEINIKDHGKDIIDKLAKKFTVENIKENFPKRSKCFVAIKDNEVVGTASIDKFRGDITDKKYIILTVFVKTANHKKGIGKMLIEKIEEYAKSINVKEILIPASIYACEFYRKLGYDYYEGKKETNDEKEYILVKYFE